MYNIMYNLSASTNTNIYLFKIVSRTIGNAALAIVKGYIKPVDVMEIKVSFVSFMHSL